MIHPALLLVWQIVPRFVLLRFVGFFLFVLFTLTSLLALFDLLAHADELSAHHDTTFLPMAYYVGLRLPSLLTMITPLSVLLAALVTFERLATQYELVALQSAGVSIYEICFFLLVGGLGVSAMHFAVASTLAKPAEVRLFRWAERNYEGLPDQKNLDPGPAWLGTARYRVHVGDAREQGRRLLEVVVVENERPGVITKYYEAKEARYTEKGWILVDGWEQTTDGGRRNPFQEVAVDLAVIPEQVANVRLPLSSLNLATLGILRAKASPTTDPPHRYETWAARSKAEPLGSLVMILLAAPIGLQLRRGGRQGFWGRFAIGMGFLFFITERILLAFGVSGDVAPSLAVWSPFACFALLGLTCLYSLQK